MTDKWHLYGKQAEDLFLAGNTLAEIADILPVSKKSLGEWSVRGQWVQMRQDVSGSTRAIQRKLTAVLWNKIQDIDVQSPNTNASVADELYKFWKMIHGVEQDSEELLKGYRVDIMVEFLQFCQGRLAQGDQEAQHSLISAFLREKVENAV